MKRLCIVLVCLTIPLQLGASVQHRQPQLAYDFCSVYDGQFGMPEMQCDVRLFGGDPNPVWLTSGTRPEWSADGLRIAVANYYLAIYNLADRSTEYLPTPDWVDGPRWSPDNTRIAFTSQMELYVINADGSALTRLTDSVGYRGAFAWAPDGASIAFGATAGGAPELFVMQADGSNKTRLTGGVGFTDSPDSGPSWSSDGARIAFDCLNDICTVNADGTNVVQRTTDPVRARNAVFSPVDGRIAFLTDRFGATEVAILEENGAVTRVAPGLWATQPAWSPGGDSLTFVNVVPDPIGCSADIYCLPGMSDTVYTVNRDGSALTQAGQGHHPRWATLTPGQPAATFTYTCPTAACQFDATGSLDPDGSITSYVWDFGDGTTGTGATPAHHYAIGKAYDVRLTVTDNTGALGISLRNVLANAPPVASFTVTCNGPTCTFDASASSDPDGPIQEWYFWVFGDGSSGEITTTPIVTHTYATGTFQSTLVIFDNGWTSASAEATVTVVNASPVAAFSVTCAGLTCAFNASASSDADDGIYFYRWDIGNGSFFTTNDPVVTRVYPVAGTYLVTLTVTDRAGQTAASSHTVTVVAPPPPPVIVEMHVGNLTGSATSLQKAWNALVTVQIHRDNHQTIGSVTVSGRWNDGSTATCQTDASGNCAFSRAGIANKSSSVTLTVTGAVFGTHVYKPAANHDPDGSSSGTGITVRRR